MLCFKPACARKVRPLITGRLRSPRAIMVIASRASRQSYLRNTSAFHHKLLQWRPGPSVQPRPVTYLFSCPSCPHVAFQLGEPGPAGLSSPVASLGFGPCGRPTGFQPVPLNLNSSFIHAWQLLLVPEVLHDEFRGRCWSCC